MSLLTLAVVFWIICLISMFYEPRNFWNALLLIFNIGLTMLAVATKPGIQGLLLGLFIMIIPLIFIVVAFFLILNGIQMFIREGHRLQNLLSLFMGIAMIVGGVGTVKGIEYLPNISVIRSVFNLILMLECYVSITFVALFLYSLLYTYILKRIQCDYIIVHGCGLKNGESVSPLLKGRVDKAVQIFRKSNESAKIVVSGGQGRDEKISEAQAMKNYLLEIGVAEDSIIMEEQSKTTYENLKNVRDMLDVDGMRNRYIFVTNNYHVFRTSLFARKLKMKAQGVGCKTAGYYWPSAFIREYIAIMVKYKWVVAFIVAVWILIEIYR